MKEKVAYFYSAKVYKSGKVYRDISGSFFSDEGGSIKSGFMSEVKKLVRDAHSIPENEETLFTALNRL